MKNELKQAGKRKQKEEKEVFMTLINHISVASHPTVGGPDLIAALWKNGLGGGRSRDAFKFLREIPKWSDIFTASR